MTLDVLKLGGWLNACDSCEVEATCGKPVGEKVQLADGGRTCVCCRLQDGYIGVQGRAHIEHLFHGRDA